MFYIQEMRLLLVQRVFLEDTRHTVNTVWWCFGHMVGVRGSCPSGARPNGQRKCKIGTACTKMLRLKSSPEKKQG